MKLRIEDEGGDLLGGELEAGEVVAGLERLDVVFDGEQRGAGLVRLVFLAETPARSAMISTASSGFSSMYSSVMNQALMSFCTSSGRVSTSSRETAEVVGDCAGEVLRAEQRRASPRVRAPVS